LPPKTRLDRLVNVRERSEETALVDLARAQGTRDLAAQRLAGLRQRARADDRGPGTAQLWVLEEFAHLQALRQVQRGESDLASAQRKEQTARVGYTSAHKNAEVARRVQDKKRAELEAERERRERMALDELATLRFNARR
jgi:flagellar export protein FliJ